MDQTELLIAAGGGLFGAFLLGWLAGWLAMRAGDPGPAPRPVPQSAPQPQPLPQPAPLTLDAEARMTAAERDVAVARDALREAQIEIEELRAYIDRRLGERPKGPDAP